MKKMRFVIAVLCMMGVLNVGNCWAVPSEADIKAVVDETIKEKKKFTGTVDLFDQNTNKVRNLMFLKFIEGIRQSGDMYVFQVDFRDKGTGDIVRIDAMVADYEKGLSVEDLVIGEINPDQGEEEEVQKEFTDDDVRAEVHKYIKQKTRFSETFDIVDTKTEKMRKLEFVEILPKIRKFGILHIVSVKFKDIEKDKNVKLDITFKNDKKGHLDVKSVMFK